MGLARFIEHTLLRADAVQSDVEQLFAEAVQWGCFGVCVQPYWVRLLTRLLAQLPARLSDASAQSPAIIPAIISVTGFPFGADRSDQKADGARRCAEDGASEVDMVVNVGAIRMGDWLTYAADIAAVRAAIPGCRLKTILETGALDTGEIEQAARIAMDEGVDFLKTCTGYGPRGATVEDVVALAPIGPVKASAGIRTREQAAALVAAGAVRLGTSAARTILGR